MKIRMLTFHTPKNYGAVLQAYSLQSVLKTRCDDVKIIDFNTPAHRAGYAITKPGHGMRVFLHNVRCLPTRKAKEKRYGKFDAFAAERFDLTRRYESFEALAAENWDADTVFFTGSDQVFNPNRPDEQRRANYLNFVPASMHKFSYAASFGGDSIPAGKRAPIGFSLKEFDRVGVREKSGVDIVKDAAGLDAEEVLDPVLLNSKDFWQKVASPYKGKPLPETFVLYYRLLRSAESDAYAKGYAAEHNCKLVTVTEGRPKDHAGMIVLNDVGPAELLWLYDKAAAVVTDSFHGLAFSLVYEKPFVFTNADEKTNLRGRSLLEKVGVLQTGYCVTRKKNETVDLETVREALSREREKSFAFLDACLETAKKEKVFVPETYPPCFCGHLTDESRLHAVASGGLATALSETVIREGGVVYGAVYTDDFRSAVYDRAEREEELGKFAGSKYLHARNIPFDRVANDLDSGREVLFIGLPCDVAALKKRVGSPENLLAVDLICHGTTSDEVVKEYLDTLEKKQGASLTALSVRYKKKAVMPAYLHASFANGKTYCEEFYKTDYGMAFRVLVKSGCFACRLRGENRASDLTIGDYWGVKETDAGFHPLGTSIAFAHTEKGVARMGRLDGFSVFPADYRKAVEGNARYLAPSVKVPEYERFAEDMKKVGLHKACDRALGTKAVIKRRVKKLLKK